MPPPAKMPKVTPVRQPATLSVFGYPVNLTPAVGGRVKNQVSPPPPGKWDGELDETPAAEFPPAVPKTPLSSEGLANPAGGIAFLELFVGLRTAHLAAKQEKVPVVASLSAETDDYANELAKKNHPEPRCIGDMNKLDKTAMVAWIATGYLVGAVVAIIVAGFPCKGS